MPTYQYKCNFCEYEFEEFQSMKEEALVRCPECGKDGLKRLIGTGGGMIFKGSGFYLTDYAKHPSDKGGSSSKKESSGDKKPEIKKTETSSDKTTSRETKTDKPTSTGSNNKAAQ